jgi:hypothetical protein
MLSIIICSRNQTITQALYNNIEETVGIPYELIIIDNSINQYSSLASAYNEGVKKSQNAILCFMHDDILYHSKNWGGNVVQHFKDPTVGMIGVGGSRYLSSIPSVWWACGQSMINESNGTICHNSIDTNPYVQTETRHNVINPAMSLSTDVVLLDGLWFCIKKELFHTISFDSLTYNGFHFYDLDISLQVHQQNKRIQAVYDITLEHISQSIHNMNWIESCFKFYRKWSKILPLSSIEYEPNVLSEIEYDNLRIFLNILKENKYFIRGLCRLMGSYFLQIAKIAIIYNWFSLYYKKKFSKRRVD